MIDKQCSVHPTQFSDICESMTQPSQKLLGENEIEAPLLSVTSVYYQLHYGRSEIDLDYSHYKCITHFGLYFKLTHLYPWMPQSSECYFITWPTEYIVHSNKSCKISWTSTFSVLIMFKSDWFDIIRIFQKPKMIVQSTLLIWDASQSIV